MATVAIIAGSILAILILALAFYAKRKQPQSKPEAAVKTADEHSSFPEKYGKDQIVVMVRDPEWLHAYWEITATKQAEFSQQFGDIWQSSNPVLRVYDITHSNSEENFYDISINDHANNWYIHVGKPDHTFFIDLGRVLPDGRFYRIARSNRVTTPRSSFSDKIDPNWPPNEAIWNIFRGQGMENIYSSLEMLEKRSD